MQAGANIERIPGLASLQDACSAGETVTIAVIDGPVDVGHPALAGARLKRVENGIRTAREAEPSRAHGTHVASILFGQPDGPVRGVAPAACGLIIPVFADGEDGGIRPCSENDLARALRLALAEGAEIINVSAGRLSDGGTAGAHLAEAVRHCVENGALIVAAAGNDGCNCLQVPAALPEVLVVGAMDGAGKPVGFSNWGETYRSRGILAPGVDVVGAEPGGAVVALSGTSFAAPLVAGAAALLMAHQRQHRRPADGRVIRDALLAGADRCDPQSAEDCDRFLAGTLNLDNALAYLNRKAAPAVATAIHETTSETRSVTMERDQGAEPAHSSNDTAEALAAQLKSLETLVAGLGETLGALRPAGPATAVPSAPVVPASGPAAVAAPRSSASTAATQAPLAAETVTPAACCDACAAAEARQLVFALGKLGYDFGTEARMDSIQSQMTARKEELYDGREPSVSDPTDLVTFLRRNMSVAPALTWTLRLDQTPIYAIQPEGYFVEDTYALLVDTLEEQVETAKEAARTGAKKPPPPALERMSLPGVINGQLRLMDGLTVPTVRPARAGMFTWSTEALVAALDKFPEKGPNDDGKEGSFEPRDGLRTFLNRIYEELRNVGLTPQDRALNFAATNAYLANNIFVKIRGRNIHIERFEVVRSPVMRPDSDCWDVKMTFYNPEAPTTLPREVYFFTIDVSDVVPVGVGGPRHWTTY